MKYTFVHISDWHGKQMDIPKADAYFVTGDMLDNYPKYSSMHCYMNGMPWIETSREVFYQSKEVNALKFRRYLGNPDAPVYIVRGNHDFVYLSNCFAGGPAFELDNGVTSFDFNGIKIGGFRGVTPINGDWSDELKDEELERRIANLPNNLDILLTHAPAHGILDKVGGYGRGPRVGIRPLTQYFNKQSYDNGTLKLHCFGHLHENFGTLKVSNILCSNAATGVIVLSWEDGVVSLKETFRL